MIITINLINSITLILSLSLFYGFIVHYFSASKITNKVLSGILFGVICVVGMMFPIEISHGVIVDPRSVVLGIAGLFGGLVVATIAASITIAYRLFLGGDGLNVGIGIIIVSAGLGFAYRYFVRKKWAKINIPQLFLFGLLIQIILLLISTQLPTASFERILSTIAIPRLVVFTFATVFLGLLLKSIDVRQKTEFALRESESNLSHHLQNTPLAAIAWDTNFRVTQWNKTAEKMFGYTADEAMGRHSVDLILIETTKIEADEFFEHVMEEKDGGRRSNKNRTKDGRKIACEWYNTPLLNRAGDVIGTASLCEDVTVRKQSEQMIWEQAHYDSLTGLANRRMANISLEKEIKVANKSNKSIAFLFLDLDGFKDINDTLGHDVGDILLIEVSKRLKSLVRSVYTIARLGGDEFVLIMGGLDNLEHVDQIANDLLKVLAQPFKLGHEEVYVSTSIGITVYPQDASDPVEMLKNADQAMYAAKNKGGNRFQYFTSSMQKNAVSRMSLINDLRTALPDEQFQLYYQPIVDLKTGDIHKAEALIRWQHPVRGLVGPIEFIPIAEETKLIVDIGDWVFREASLQSARWRDSLNPNFQISINTSPIQYKNEAFSANDWLEYLQTLKLPGDAIMIEITEGALMEYGKSIDQKLLDFRDANIQVALDDFGTGYSSLYSLKKLDIDYLKIDKSFVDNLEPDSSDLALCEAIIVMAHKLDLKVVAEGVEDEQQKNLLIAAGCDYAQGYLFSKPVSAIEFETLFRSQ